MRYRFFNRKVYVHLNKAHLRQKKSQKIFSCYKSAKHENKKQARQERKANANENERNYRTAR